ncbi:helix-turn-helix domain-containing protein [Aquibacillus sp. 3ASR75-11]|uniref:Helix-turn-helix domain-containing protein n=1 Tax=Terrihalobacillus insolitus TaxID=2950438 RepID=A0A9X3WUZ5_9BACI|nr:helix-turn-helix transcriptional regulator [Terrihalobacillus insolitus]MDC3414843.1 helix-turn-helix domain-containing protein [Terrihalobacillus insolitus]MDC3426242.1 helix-turn-helix domain-containing protein [Terrihalobacillus insolitus]
MESVDWGKRIRAYRKLKGYTQVSFARKLGISVSVVGEIERSIRVPTKCVMQNICTTLNVSIEELMPKQDTQIK